MKYSLLFSLFLALTATVSAQYNFKDVKRVGCTPVKNQQRTGTCWSYATASLLESEVARMGKGDIDLSEMFVVRNIYQDKAMNYVLRQGKANFSQGSLSHDLMRMVSKVGIVPQGAYKGKRDFDKGYDHSEMEAGMKGFLDGISKSKQLSPKWMDGLNAIMDVYMGPVPSTFDYKGKEYTPEEFANYLGINGDDYLSYTSFTHHAFGEEFILEIPDNYSNGSFINVPMNDLLALVHHAIDNGYSVAWDGDVSEVGFSAKNGIAVLPTDPKREDLFTKIGDEIEVTQEARQANFMNYSTTDDHLMHLVGKAKDKAGNIYFIIKNSWGEISEHKGFLYMSEAYFKMKTVAIMLHKDGVPNKLSK